MKSKKVIRWILYGCAFLSAVVCAFCVSGIVILGGRSSGSNSLAAEWRDQLSQHADPEKAQAVIPEIVTLRFRNGEWVFGLSKDSHGMWRRGGGTLVVRDSRGLIRVFFGHVCGSGHLGEYERDIPSLEAYYDHLVKYGFKEQLFD
jgi:hypothetical protein